MLTHLDLSYNLLQNIDKDQLTECLPNLMEVDLGFNPLCCSCDLLFELIIIRNITIPNLTYEVTRGSPCELKGKSIFIHELLFCSEDSVSLCLFGFSVFFTLAFLAVPTMECLFGWELWYTFCLCLVHFQVWSVKKSSAEEVEYDAVVAFKKDQEAVANWVYNELQVRMEDWLSSNFVLKKETGFQGDPCWKTCGIQLAQEQENNFCAFQVPARERHPENYLSPGTAAVVGGQKGCGGVNSAGEDGKEIQVNPIQLWKCLCKKTVLFWPKKPCWQQCFGDKFRTALGKDNHRLYGKKYSLSF